MLDAVLLMKHPAGVRLSSIQDSGFAVTICETAKSRRFPRIRWLPSKKQSAGNHCTFWAVACLARF